METFDMSFIGNECHIITKINYIITRKKYAVKLT